MKRFKLVVTVFTTCFVLSLLTLNGSALGKKSRKNSVTWRQGSSRKFSTPEMNAKEKVNVQSMRRPAYLGML